MTNTERTDRGICKLEGCNVCHKRNSAIGDRHHEQARLAAETPAKQTAIEQVETAAVAAGLNVRPNSVLHRTIVISADNGDHIIVEADRAGRLIDAKRHTASSATFATMPAAGLKTRVLAWIGTHEPLPNVRPGGDVFDELDEQYLAADGFDTRGRTAARAIPAEQPERRDEIMAYIGDDETPVRPYHVTDEMVISATSGSGKSAVDSYDAMLDRGAGLMLLRTRTMPSRTTVTGKCGDAYCGWCLFSGPPRELNPEPDLDAIEVDVLGPADALRYEIGVYDEREHEIVHGIMLRSRAQAERLYRALGTVLGY